MLTKYEDYKIHELARKVPTMSATDYRLLKANIQEIGQTSPIITYKGEIIDGRNRLKICLELGFVPWIREYDGDQTIAQYILSTNIRRNLTKLEREQMLADFAAVIIPEIKQEMHQGKRTDLLLKKSSEVTANHDKQHGRAALATATGASAWEAQLLKSIHDKAPELLSEVKKHGGLRATEKEARKRAKAKAPAKAKPTNGKETHGQRIIRMTSQMKDAKIGLTKEEIDPDFKGTHQDWVTQYGHLRVRTKAQMEAEKDHQAFSDWLSAIRALRGPLKDYLKVGTFTPWNIENWIKKAGDRREKRITEVKELFSMIDKAHQTIELLQPIVERFKDGSGQVQE